MTFDGAKLGYEKSRLNGFTIQELLGKREEKFAMSGFDDLIETMRVIEEFYGQIPLLDIKELDTSAVDEVFLEVKGQRRYTRVIQMPVFLQQETPRHKRDAYGETVIKTTVANFAIVELIKANYLPSAGDIFRFLNEWFEITRVYVDPKDYYQQSGFPLYLRADTRIANFDSRNLGDLCGKDDLGKTDMGAPSTLQPGDTLSELVVLPSELPELIVH